MIKEFDIAIEKNGLEIVIKDLLEHLKNCRECDELKFSIDYSKRVYHLTFRKTYGEHRFTEGYFYEKEDGTWYCEEELK